MSFLRRGSCASDVAAKSCIRYCASAAASGQVSAGSSQEKFLELFLATSQGRLIGLKRMEALTANFRRFLIGHAAVLVEVDRVVLHGLISFFWLPFRRRSSTMFPASWHAASGRLTEQKSRTAGGDEPATPYALVR